MMLNNVKIHWERNCFAKYGNSITRDLGGEVRDGYLKF